MIAALLLLAQVTLNPSFTPGAVRPLSKATVCQTKWSADRRHVTERMKRDVAAKYGVPWSQHGDYEFDHLIPRELGGADDVANLWPQAWAEARVKDREENRLHRAVCRGEISLRTAQRRMRQWGLTTTP